jgi:two-component system, OmpR family, heavy metal sensor histidine kinase CusS
MKSIRRTLILNVTALIVLAFGTVAALVYRINSEAIEDKQRFARQLVAIQFEDQRDAALLDQARDLASEAQSQFDPVKFRQFRDISYALSPVLVPGSSAHIAAPVWLAEHLPGGLVSFRFSLQAATNLKMSEIEATKYGYVQVNSDWNVWRSNALAGLKLPWDTSGLDPEKRFDWKFDFTEVSPGVQARRVRMKSPLTRFRVQIALPEPSPENASLGIAAGLRRAPTPFDSRPSRPRSVNRSGPPGGPGSGPPTIYIQIAWDSTHGHPQLLHRLEAERDDKLLKLDDEIQAATTQLKQRLIWIGGVTLAVIIVGGWLLVGVGLFPLKRLSDAVSWVSAKNFKLPIDPKELPKEVLPVADRLKLTLHQLEEAFAREKRAAADISHELRTPLAALTTTLEVALRKQRSPEDYRQTIEDARQIARQMSSLVERMLALAWIDAGADEMRVQAVNLDQLVAGCAAIGKPLAEAQGLRFQVNAEKALTVRTDPDKLREIVMNLLHNAIEYNRPGGEVEITARSKPVGGVVVEVRDTGIGIPAELYEKIFERFYRGDPSRNAAGVHAGLGLAIVKEYVDRMGGRLSVESTVGAGSRFRLELP